MEETLFWVIGLTGIHCKRHITQSLTSVPGVERVYVDLSRNEVTVWGTAPRLTLDEAIRSAGFGLSPFPVPEQRGVG